MTEPQDIADDNTAAPSQEPVGEAMLRSESTIDVDGRSWVVVELDDHESWDLYAGTSPDRGSRLAHVWITDGGYFSTDRAGTVRGPYVTLSEATYPLGLDDPLLLGDVVEQAPISEVTPSDPSLPALQGPDAAGGSWVREVLLVVSVVGLVLFAQWAVSARRKPRRASA